MKIYSVAIPQDVLILHSFIGSAYRLITVRLCKENKIRRTNSGDTVKPHHFLCHADFYKVPQPFLISQKQLYLWMVCDYSKILNMFRRFKCPVIHLGVSYIRLCRKELINENALQRDCLDRKRFHAIHCFQGNFLFFCRQIIKHS